MAELGRVGRAEEGSASPSRKQALGRCVGARSTGRHQHGVLRFSCPPTLLTQHCEPRQMGASVGKCLFRVGGGGIYIFPGPPTRRALACCTSYKAPPWPPHPSVHRMDQIPKKLRRLA